MKQHNPPSVGEFIKETYLKSYGLSMRQLAKHLKINNSTLQNIINHKGRVSVKMARKLEAVLGRSAESWLEMQVQYDLANCEKVVSLEKIDFDSLLGESK